jgi:hypothetical protein
LLKEEVLKMKLPAKRVYVVHIKSQYLKLVKKELRELGIESVELLKDGDVIRL